MNNLALSLIDICERFRFPLGLADSHPELSLFADNTRQRPHEDQTTTYQNTTSLPSSTISVTSAILGRILPRLITNAQWLSSTPARRPASPTTTKQSPSFSSWSG